MFGWGDTRQQFWGESARGVLPFLAVHVLVLTLLIAFPALVMTPLRWLLP